MKRNEVFLLQKKSLFDTTTFVEFISRRELCSKTKMYDDDKDLDGGELDLTDALADDESLFPVEEELIDEEEPLHVGMKLDDEDAEIPEEMIM
ncbi:MAG TPA: hypothetical protein PK950_00170 [Candidatus Paceibacterota bacterium]|nr:hypothetical protein [Candidatus Paceibacterota bacterium]